jgi:hypothetical protein
MLTVVFSVVTPCGLVGELHPEQGCETFIRNVGKRRTGVLGVTTQKANIDNFRINYSETN